MLKKITFLCTGNICRSPIAEGLAKHLFASKNFTISSLGTGALVGEPADPAAVQVASQHDIDIGQHIARQASEKLLKDSDLILALDRSHTQWALANFPFLRGRVHLLGKWSREAEVPDPYRKPIEMFETAYVQIEKFVTEWASRLG